METQVQTAFERTLEGYAQGFHVSHIATFDLETCSPDEDSREVFQRFPLFDQIPVRDGERVVGVLERPQGEIPCGRVSTQMRMLDDSLLVSGDATLKEFFPLIARPPYYRLVLQGAKINGIVTRSDMLKLPVRLYVFALVTNLELLMMEIIKQQLPQDNDWLPLLSTKRQENVINKQKMYASQRMDPLLIEFTDFCDKRVILKEHLNLGKTFEKDLKDIENVLRNPLAHAATFVEDDAGLERFIRTLESTHTWIQQLGKYLSEVNNIQG